MSTATNLEPTNSLRAAQSAYGDVDIRAGVPAGFVHLPSPGASRVCSRLGIEFARAIVGFRTSSYGSGPQFKGVVVNTVDAARIPPAKSQPSTGARTRGELAKLDALGEADLLTLSVECLHALNRRAKAYPEKATAIYTLKNRFLRAAVLAGVAEVGRFQTERVTGYYHECTCSSGRYYYEDDDYDDDAYAREPRVWYSREERSFCRSCGATSAGVPQSSSRVWYLVRILGRGFHQPGPIDPVFERVAVPIEVHDPTNHNTDIPKIGWTIAVQHVCVERAATLLEQAESAWRAELPQFGDQAHPLPGADACQGQEVSHVAQL